MNAGLHNASMSLELIKPFFMVSWSFLPVFLFSEFGEMLSEQFALFNDVLNQCKWYQLPLPMQRMLMIVMANAQRTTKILGFGNLFCRRIAFKKVCQSILHY